jgi:hypothetical protein
MDTNFSSAPCMGWLLVIELELSGIRVEPDHGRGVEVVARTRSLGLPFLTQDPITVPQRS